MPLCMQFSHLITSQKDVTFYNHHWRKAVKHFINKICHCAGVFPASRESGYFTSCSHRREWDLKLCLLSDRFWKPFHCLCSVSYGHHQSPNITSIYWRSFTHDIWACGALALTLNTITTYKSSTELHYHTINECCSV